MEFTIKSGSPEKQRSACVVVGVFDNRKLSLSAELIDRASNGYISEIIRRGDMEGKLGSTLLLHSVRGTLADRVLLVGLGKERDFRDKEFRQAIRAAVKLLNETGSYEAVLYLTEEKVKRREVAWRVEHAVIVSMDAVYRFEQMKSEPTEVRRPLRKLTLSVPQRSDLSAGEAAAARGLAIAHGMDFAKDLGNLPSNVCTPTYLGERALELGREFPDIKVTVMERAQIEALGMGTFLSVTKGSAEPPRFIVLQYEHSARKQKPIVLVGKGITFDTGGISIKPSADMDQMKFDMCGAASVFGTLRAIAELKAKLNVVGLVPTCENMPSGHATKPGDIVKSMSGQTVEILNTDA
ncbi:MAG TPA: leucyl aminopeptidase, partial [Casimicrobiaceae bacterium]|nr:leucyl aminopeptidase [Casimicrobiaceae bacterium]